MQCDFDSAALSGAYYEGFSNPAGEISFELSPGSYSVDCSADNSSTPAYDYYRQDFTLDVPAKSRVPIFLSQVSTLFGSVSNNGSFVQGSQIQLRCAGDISETPVYSVTDEYGSFLMKNAPSGDCVVYARHDTAATSTPVNLRVGQISNVDLQLEYALEQPASWLNSNVYTAILAVLVLIILAYLAYRAKPAQVVKEKQFVAPHEPVKQASHPVDARMSAVISTLDEREKSVVSYLLEHGASRESTVRKALMIPKATFFRVVKRLETKRIIRVDKHENRAVMRPTKWFLTGKQDEA
ncbi:hypothetical protein AUJ14_05835 [Candidatus Micrarchaeota archaeon CG1_02_55_22]|nr:MAG: hypothetical protein AUJ14_05835 [Candidatus Micrarchaeota archaeon CG1_02_55_22]